MVIRVGLQRYVIPTLSIVRMIQPTEQNLSHVFDRVDMLSVGDRQLPLYRLDLLFKIPGATQDVTQASVVIVEHDQRQFALLVDELVGQQQIVIKPLGEMLSSTPGLSGGANCGSGCGLLSLPSCSPKETMAFLWMGRWTEPWRGRASVGGGVLPANEAATTLAQEGRGEGVQDQSALRVAVEYPDLIDLLLTDVMTPGMTGVELAHELAKERSAMKVAFMSGNVDHRLGRHVCRCLRKHTSSPSRFPPLSFESSSEWRWIRGARAEPLFR